MVQHCLEERVGKEAAAAVEGGQVPDDAAAVAAGCHTLLSTAGLHLDAVHRTLVLLHDSTACSDKQATQHMTVVSLQTLRQKVAVHEGEGGPFKGAKGAAGRSWGEVGGKPC